MTKSKKWSELSVDSTVHFQTLWTANEWASACGLRASQHALMFVWGGSNRHLVTCRNCKRSRAFAELRKAKPRRKV